MPVYKFDQIAINSTDKKKPVEEDKNTYIGLEHLEPGNLRVARFGSDVAPIGEKLLMRKGDVLFGKRRAYQKKVGIAPFDGIFSAHGMVLRPRADVIIEDLFPFFIRSDQFLDEAIKISVGSLSPTINWRDLKELEFQIPEINIQVPMAEELWAIEDAKEAYYRLMSATDELVKSQFIEMFGNPVTNPMGWPIKRLGDIADYFIGLTYKPSDASEKGVIVLRAGNIQDGAIELSDIVRVSTNISEKLYVRENDILMCSRNGSEHLVGKVALISDLVEQMTFGAFMTIIRSTHYRYLHAFFQLDAFRKQISTAKTSTINQITKSMLDAISLPLPDLNLQNKFASFVIEADKSKFVVAKQIMKT